MWPIAAAELVRVCGGTCELALGNLSLEAITIGDIPAGPRQVYFPVQEDIDGHAFVGAALGRGVPLAVVERGWAGLTALSARERERCILVDSAVAAFRRLAAHLRGGFSFQVIAVAGSNGKTTTKDCIAALLAGAGLTATKTPQTMNGWTGLPFTLCLAAHRRDAPPDALVVEIGIDALGAMEEHARLVRPDVAVITALGPEHLSGLGSTEAAAREELGLFASPDVKRVFHLEEARIREAAAGARAGDVVVARGDREAPLAEGVCVLRYEPRVVSPRCAEVVLEWQPAGASPWRGSAVLPLGGAHNAANLALAFAAAAAIGRAPPESLCPERGPGCGVSPRGPLRMAVPAMRCQIDTLASGTVLIDDGYNASPASVEAALALLSAPGWRRREKCILLGDMLDLGAESGRLHEALVPLLGRARDLGARLLLVGEAMRPVAGALDATWLAADTRPEDIAAALAATAGDVVLVKASRGMRFERVTAVLREEHKVAARVPADIAVVGCAHHERAAVLTAAAIGLHGSAKVRATTERAARGAVFTDFVRDPRAQSPEHQLARMAQPFMHLGEGAFVVLNADDEVSAVLAEAIPAHVRRIYFGFAAGAVRGALEGDTLRVQTPDGKMGVRLRGEYFVEALAAAAVAFAAGELEGAADGIEGAALEMA